MDYLYPDINILKKSSTYDQTEQLEQAAREGDVIVDTLEQLGARCEIDHDLTVIAPQVIRYSAIAAEKIAVRKIPALAPELMYSLGAESVVINAPMPGTKYITIEIPAPCRRLVTLGDIIDSASSPLTFPAGITTDNKVLSINIKDLPHCLIAGTTGSGKSSALLSIISSLLMKTTPDELMFYLFDSKMVELPIFDGIENLVFDCITDSYEAINHFKVIVDAMENRYKLSQEYGAKDFDSLNSKLSADDKLPYILVVVDEVADLMALSKHEIEESIVRIAQKSRAVGIHLLVATQSPRREVITGLLRANLPSKIGFSTSSGLDSRIILGQNGCEKLLGSGDCLYSSQGREPIRLQAPYIFQTEIESIVSSLRAQSAPRELIAA